jgi:hypothetical protein
MSFERPEIIAHVREGFALACSPAQPDLAFSRRPGCHEFLGLGEFLTCAVLLASAALWRGDKLATFISGQHKRRLKSLAGTLHGPFFWRLKRSDVRVALAVEYINHDARGCWKNASWLRFLSGHFVVNDVTSDFLPGRLANLQIRRID